MLRSARVLIMVILISAAGRIFFLEAEEEKLTVTAYHPSPSGSYNEITTTSNTYLAVNSGNVGIGTTAPLGLLQAGTSPTPGLFVTAAGNVGMGTTDPGSYKLYVANLPLDELGRERSVLYVTGTITSGTAPASNPHQTGTPPPLVPRIHGDLRVVRWMAGPNGNCILRVENGVIKSTNCDYHSDP